MFFRVHWLIGLFSILPLRKYFRSEFFIPNLFTDDYAQSWFLQNIFQQLPKLNIDFHASSSDCFDWKFCHLPILFFVTFFSRNELDFRWIELSSFVTNNDWHEIWKVLLSKHRSPLYFVKAFKVVFNQKENFFFQTPLPLLFWITLLKLNTLKFHVRQP